MWYFPAMRRSFVVSCCLVAVAACAQAQTPSNVGGDGIDRGAASAALGSIERSACTDVAGPNGKVHVTVVFATDGNVTDAKFDHGFSDTPTTIAGTPRGDCLLARFPRPPRPGIPRRADEGRAALDARLKARGDDGEARARRACEWREGSRSVDRSDVRATP